jgi:hypothetical protein
MANSKASASSSSPTDDEEADFNKMRKSVDLFYAYFGGFAQDDLNELKEEWFPGEPEKKGILQAIWQSHPKNNQCKTESLLIY